MTETFFRPPELARERLTIPPDLYNLCRLALARSGREHVFVAIRALQVQAVIDRQEVIFVDGQAYAVQDGQGGRLVCLAWVFRHDVGRAALSEPAPIELVYYRDDSRRLHGRLVGEFARALEAAAAREEGGAGDEDEATVLPFRH